MNNVDFSSKNGNFGKLVSTTMHTSSRHLKAFLEKSSDINNFDLFYNVDILPTLRMKSFPWYDKSKHS